ncbi:MAG: PPC domain-containing DNA-binding protein [bacterium]|jgi:predicted DNA-binding protein with PD1-like motif
MKYELSGIEKNVIVCRLDKEDEIINSLKELVKKQNIYGGFFYGIGAVKNVILSYYDLASKQYIDKEFNGEYEIVSLLGNIGYIYASDEVVIHTHMSISDSNFNVYGGHLKKAIVSVTCELFIVTINDKLERVFDENIGLYLFKY